MKGKKVSPNDVRFNKILPKENEKKMRNNDDSSSSSDEENENQNA